MNRATAWLRMARVANLPTAAADVLAGFLLAGGAGDDWHRVAAMMGVSMAIYAAGVVLNDVCDAKSDAVQRPERPIPSGRIDRGRATRVATVLFVCAIAGAWLIERRAPWDVLALIACVIAYDAGLKRSIAGPIVMGLCRAANWTLGWHLAASTLDVGLFVPAGVVGLYVASVTVFARRENASRKEATHWIAMAGILLAASAAAWVGIRSDRPPEAAAVMGALLMLAVGPGTWRAIRAATAAPQLQSAVGLWVSGIVLLDAVLVTASRGIGYGLMVAACLLPTLVLRRQFAMS